MTVHNERIIFPDIEQYPDIPLFNTKAVVQQTGIPAPTLRAWERRYAILSPERANNDYRLYSERDIVMIRWLKEQVDSGMSISQAIAFFRHLQAERRQLHTSSIESQPPSLEAEQPETPVSEEHPALEIPLPAPSQPDEPLTHMGSHNDAASLKIQAEHLASLGLLATQQRLVEAFRNLEEPIANRLVSEALSIYSVEQVCIELITPTLWKIGDLWEQGQVTVSVEHFASAFFRGLLTSLLRVTPTITTGPLILDCCAPGEAHEIGSLMLALFMRRAGLRVIYLGQSIEIPGLLRTVKQVSPALVCVSMTLPLYMEAVIELAKQLAALPAPRPMFVFGGQGFNSLHDLLASIPGTYLSGDLSFIIEKLKAMLQS